MAIGNRDSGNQDSGNQALYQDVRGPRAIAGPVAIAAGVAVAAAVLHVRDPHVAGAYGVCPTYALTGLWCPACGGLRAVHHLTNFDIGAAVGSNMLVVPVLVAAVIVWIRWVVRRWQGSRGRLLTIRPSATVAVVFILVAFTVIRNTPWGSWLAPA